MRTLFTLLGLVLLAACSSDAVTVERPGPYYPENRERARWGEGATTIWGDGDGITLFSSNDRENGTGGGGGIGVNAYLWRATLDTLNFLPLASADPFGGVVITDWYAPPEAPNERFKLTVYILDTALRADGLNVSVFKQVNDGGTWRDAPVDPAVATELEDKILTSARELRVASLETTS